MHSASASDSRTPLHFYRSVDRLRCAAAATREWIEERDGPNDLPCWRECGIASFNRLQSRSPLRDALVTQPSSSATDAQQHSSGSRVAGSARLSSVSRCSGLQGPPAGFLAVASVAPAAHSTSLDSLLLHLTDCSLTPQANLSASASSQFLVHAADTPLTFLCLQPHTQPSPCRSSSWLAFIALLPPSQLSLSLTKCRSHARLCCFFVSASGWSPQFGQDDSRHGAAVAPAVAGPRRAAAEPRHAAAESRGVLREWRGGEEDPVGVQERGGAIPIAAAIRHPRLHQ